MDPETDETLNETVTEQPTAKPQQGTSVYEPLRTQLLDLPRYSHGLLPQSMVASQMVDDPNGEWIRRADVLDLL